VSADPSVIRRAALSLPVEERADLAAELLASLEDNVPTDDAGVSELWSREIERRARRVVAGANQGDEWSALRQRLTDDLAGR
jgi:hypothetical protein